MKQFSSAAERNKQPILEHLKRWLRPGDHILEIGSGTGQHAHYFTQNIPEIIWQCTDLNDNLSSLNQESFELDVTTYDWASRQYDIIYSANALHIMSWKAACIFLENAVRALKTKGRLILYGPYEYSDKSLCESNRAFNQFLQTRDAASGIRNFEAVNAILIKSGFKLVEDITMPANNQLLLWSI